MKKLLRHMDIIHYILLFLGGIAILSTLVFMTQYNTVTVATEGTGDALKCTAEMTNARGTNQALLFKYFGASWDGWKTVYNFQTAANAVNNLILVFGIVMVLGACLLCILQNHKRKIYYTSNVLGAFLVCVGVAVFGVIILLKLFGLMGQISANKAMFNAVAVLQHPTLSGNYNTSFSGIESVNLVSNLTILIYVALFAVCIVYSLFVLILTFAKFSRTKERRKEIISKAVENND